MDLNLPLWLVDLKDGKLRALGPKEYLQSLTFEPKGVVGLKLEKFDQLPNDADVVILVNESDLSDLGKAKLAYLISASIALIPAKKSSIN